MIVLGPIALVLIICVWNYSIDRAVTKKMELLRKDILDEMRSMIVDHEDNPQSHRSF